MASAALNAGPQARLRDLFGQAFAAADALLARRLVWATCIGGVLALQGWHVLTHVAWSDEWQALFIALQSADFAALLENLRYEGHPPLWYLLLRGGGAVIGWRELLPVVQLGIALAIQLIVLLRAPFSRSERLLLALSYFLLFEYGALARSLSLGALLTIGFFAARGPWLRWAIVVLLPMVDFQFGLLSLVGIALTIRDGQFRWAPAALWAVSALFSAWTVLPAADMATSQGGAGAAVLKLFDDFSALLLPVQTIDGRIGWSGGWPWGLGLPGGALFLWFALGQLRQDRLHAWLFSLFLAGTCLFSVAVYSLSIRHLTLVALLLILLKWREAEQGRALSAAMRLWLIGAAMGGFGVSAVSATRPFDSAPQVAAYIRANGLAERNWVAWRPERGFTVGAELGRDMAIPQGGAQGGKQGACAHSFIRWNFRDEIKNEAALVAALQPFVARYGRSYLITTLPPEKQRDPLLRFLKGFPAGYDGYPYYLYVVGPALTESARRPPPCTAKRRQIEGWASASRAGN